ncbi:thioredoxin domain-containing protein, partial [Hyaloraphidium curvatum]
DFKAVWCGPCKQIAPVFTKLAAENPDVLFLQADVDEQEEVAKQEDIEAMPTFKVKRRREARAGAIRAARGRAPC